MEFKKEIKINDEVYEFVDIQRDGLSAIYKNMASYLRIGAPSKISKDLAFHKKMEAYGFPVASLLVEGEHEGQLYFIEESLGEKCFGYIFKEETEKYGQIQEETFDQFIAITLKFAKTQLNTVTEEKNWIDFEKGIHLGDIFQELPAEKERIIVRWEQVKTNLSKFPFVISHGDFTPFNIYPSGVIDLEDSFVASVGYDTGAATETLNWFPESRNYEYYRLYDFTKEQENRYLLAIDNLYLSHNLPKISDHLDDFNFAKGIWFTVQNYRNPKIQKFRYDTLLALLK